MAAKRKHYIFAKTLGVIILLGICVFTLFFAYKSANIYQAELTRSLIVQEYSAQTLAKLYKTVKLPNSAKPFAVLPYEYRRDFGRLVLVSKSSPINQGYTPQNLANVTMPAYMGDGQIQVKQEVNDALASLNGAANKAGLYIMVRSGYRPFTVQQQLKLVNINDEHVANAGESEHQTGLAVDFNSSNINCGYNCGLDAQTASWLAQNAPKYGFILRYPIGKQAITSYPYENWHFRYVGIDAAKAITESGLTFDEAYSQIIK